MPGSALPAAPVTVTLVMTSVTSAWGGSVSERPTERSRLPAAGERLRCRACGNLTRFDVVATRRTAAFWHYSLAGELSVEEERDLGGVAEQVRCRWCGADNQVEVVPSFGAHAEAAPGEEGAAR
jgi:hypothetical protein